MPNIGTAQVSMVLAVPSSVIGKTVQIVKKKLGVQINLADFGGNFAFFFFGRQMYFGVLKYPQSVWRMR